MGEDDINSSTSPVVDLIDDLASARPDTITEDARNELVENVTNLLSEDGANRQSFADHKGVCVCVRVCYKLFIQIISQQNKDTSKQKNQLKLTIFVHFFLTFSPI